MKNSNEIFKAARQLHFSGKIKESQKLYLKLLKNNEDNDKLLFLVGTTYLQLKNYNKAINYLRLSIKHNQNFPDSYNNIGIALAETKDYLTALNNYNEAIKLNSNFLEAYLNKGIALNKLEQYNEAIDCLKLVIKSEPLNPKAYLNLGNIYRNIEDFDEAILAYNKAININPNLLEAHSNAADLMEKFKKFDGALVYLNQIYKKNPNFNGVLGKIIFNKMKICDWDNYSEIIQLIKKRTLEKKDVINPLVIHYLSNDPKLLKIHTEEWISKNIDQTENKIKSRNNNFLKKEKIHIGYFSADFHEHPVLNSMANVYKNHDKSKFKLFAFSHGIEKDNPWRDKIKSEFDEFFIINNLSDEKVIKLCRDNKIDIAVNLTGHTKNMRNNLFAKNIAPINVNYLGYPGTLGTKNFNYIIADKIVIPTNEVHHYSEKVFYMPECFIPKPTNLFQEVKNVKFSREDFKLPENKLIFCAIHNPLKINPKLLSTWANILTKVDNSILWVNGIDEIYKENFIKEIQKRKLKKNRIIFADKLNKTSDHLERLKLADIFLDAHPYNAHSTTYDILDAHLPMVTMKGNSFASRVASSILSSYGLNELIAINIKNYEDIAIELANNKTKREKIKNKLKDLKSFNHKHFTNDLEKLYYKMINKNFNLS